MRTKKEIPTFKSDRAAAAFVDKADLTQYDLSGARLTRFEIKPKDKSINLRLSGQLYYAIRKRAARAGIPYRRFIRLTLEQAIGGTEINAALESGKFRDGNLTIVKNRGCVVPPVHSRIGCVLENNTLPPFHPGPLTLCATG